MIPGFTPSTMAASKGNATAPDFTKGEPFQRDTPTIGIWAPLDYAAGYIVNA